MSGAPGRAMRAVLHQRPHSAVRRQLIQSTTDDGTASWTSQGQEVGEGAALLPVAQASSGSYMRTSPVVRPASAPPQGSRLAAAAIAAATAMSTSTATAAATSSSRTAALAKAIGWQKVHVVGTEGETGSAKGQELPLSEPAITPDGAPSMVLEQDCALPRADSPAEARMETQSSAPEIIGTSVVISRRPQSSPPGGRRPGGGGVSQPCDDAVDDTISSSKRKRPSTASSRIHDVICVDPVEVFGAGAPLARVEVRLPCALHELAGGARELGRQDSKDGITTLADESQEARSHDAADPGKTLADHSRQTSNQVDMGEDNVVLAAYHVRQDRMRDLDGDLGQGRSADLGWGGGHVGTWTSLDQVDTDESFSVGSNDSHGDSASGWGQAPLGVANAAHPRKLHQLWHGSLRELRPQSAVAYRGLEVQGHSHQSTPRQPSYASSLPGTAGRPQSARSTYRLLASDQAGGSSHVQPPMPRTGAGRALDMVEIGAIASSRPSSSGRCRGGQDQGPGQVIDVAAPLAPKGLPDFVNASDAPALVEETPSVRRMKDNWHQSPLLEGPMRLGRVPAVTLPQQGGTAAAAPPGDVVGPDSRRRGIADGGDGSGDGATTPPRLMPMPMGNATAATAAGAESRLKVRLHARPKSGQRHARYMGPRDRWR